eukprot:UN25564
MRNTSPVLQQAFARFGERRKGGFTTETRNLSRIVADFLHDPNAWCHEDAGLF